MHKDFKIKGFDLNLKSGPRLLISLMTDVPLTTQEKNVFGFIEQWIAPTSNIEVMTSGSTGTPRSISIPKEWMRRSSAITAQHLELGAGMKACLCIPAQFIGGMMMMVRAMEIGMELSITDPVLHVIAEDSYDFTAMTPAQVANILSSGQSLEQFGSVIIGGAPISQELERTLKEEPGIIHATYGMTETVSHIALRRVNGHLSSDYFTVMEGVRIITDLEDRLCITIPYFDDLIVETTDLVLVENENTFKWIGRSDHVINSGALKIHPEIIESMLSQHIESPFMISSEPDTEFGSIVILVIESDKLVRIDESLRSAIAELGNKRPKKIYRTKSFYRSATGKLLRDTDELDLTLIPHF